MAPQQRRYQTGTMVKDENLLLFTVVLVKQERLLVDIVLVYYETI